MQTFQKLPVGVVHGFCIDHILQPVDLGLPLHELQADALSEKAYLANKPAAELHIECWSTPTICGALHVY